GIVGDVSRKQEIHPIAIQILGALGGLDVLINNASDLGPAPLQLLADTECEDFERALATNVLGPFRLTKTLLGALAASARDKAHPGTGARPSPGAATFTGGEALNHSMIRVDSGVAAPGDGRAPMEGAASVVLNISSDAALNPYPRWGAY